MMRKSHLIILAVCLLWINSCRQASTSSIRNATDVASMEAAFKNALQMASEARPMSANTFYDPQTKEKLANYADAISGRSAVEKETAFTLHGLNRDNYATLTRTGDGDAGKMSKYWKDMSGHKLSGAFALGYKGKLKKCAPDMEDIDEDVVLSEEDRALFEDLDVLIESEGKKKRAEWDDVNWDYESHLLRQKLNMFSFTIAKGKLKHKCKKGKGKWVAYLKTDAFLDDYYDVDDLFLRSQNVTVRGRLRFKDLGQNSILRRTLVQSKIEVPTASGIKGAQKKDIRFDFMGPLQPLGKLAAESRALVTASIVSGRDFITFHDPEKFAKPLNVLEQIYSDTWAKDQRYFSGDESKVFELKQKAALWSRRSRYHLTFTAKKYMAKFFHDLSTIVMGRMVNLSSEDASRLHDKLVQVFEGDPDLNLVQNRDLYESLTASEKTVYFENEESSEVSRQVAAAFRILAWKKAEALKGVYFAKEPVSYMNVGSFLELDYRQTRTNRVFNIYKKFAKAWRDAFGHRDGGRVQARQIEAIGGMARALETRGIMEYLNIDELPSTDFLIDTFDQTEAYPPEYFSVQHSSDPAATAEMIAGRIIPDINKSFFQTLVNEVQIELTLEPKFKREMARLDKVRETNPAPIEKSEVRGYDVREILFAGLYARFLRSRALDANLKMSHQKIVELTTKSLPKKQFFASEFYGFIDGTWLEDDLRRKVRGIVRDNRSTLSNMSEEERDNFARMEMAKEIIGRIDSIKQDFMIPEVMNLPVYRDLPNYVWFGGEHERTMTAELPSEVRSLRGMGEAGTAKRTRFVASAKKRYINMILGQYKLVQKEITDARGKQLMEVLKDADIATSGVTWGDAGGSKAYRALGRLTQ